MDSLRRFIYRKKKQKLISDGDDVVSGQEVPLGAELIGAIPGSILDSFRRYLLRGGVVEVS